MLSGGGGNNNDNVALNRRQDGFEVGGSNLDMADRLGFFVTPSHSKRLKRFRNASIRHRFSLILRSGCCFI